MNKQDLYQQEKIRKVKLLDDANKYANKNQIVCAGSSLMEMFPIEKFIEECKENVIVYNRGIGGYIARELLENINVCILDLNPSRLFINIGTNDLSYSNVTIEMLMHDYSMILSKIKESIPNIEIYIMAYFPVNEQAATPEMKECLKIRTNKKINEANEALKVLAEKFSSKYIDINANLKDSLGRLKQQYTIEGVHINEEGYRAIFDDFMKYAKEPKWKSL